MTGTSPQRTARTRTPALPGIPGITVSPHREIFFQASEGSGYSKPAGATPFAAGRRLGTFTQTGSAVTVTHASYDGAIAANGGTTSIGLDGTDTGPDPAPTVLALDGTVCSSD